MVLCHGVAVTFKSLQLPGQVQLSGAFTWNPHPLSWQVANSVRRKNPHNWFYPCGDTAENAPAILCGSHSKVASKVELEHAKGTARPAEQKA